VVLLRRGQSRSCWRIHLWRVRTWDFRSRQTLYVRNHKKTTHLVKEQQQYSLATMLIFNFVGLVICATFAIVISR